MTATLIATVVILALVSTVIALAVALYRALTADYPAAVAKLDGELYDARVAKEALADEVRVLNAMLEQSRGRERKAHRKFRRERAWHKRTEAALHETAVEREELRKRLGLTK